MWGEPVLHVRKDDLEACATGGNRPHLRQPPRVSPTAADRQAANLQREAASGVLRIFGVAPGYGSRKPPEALSDRERQIADLLAMGFTNAGIARHLNLSPNTVASHVGRTLAKLGFRSRTQIATWVIEGRLAAAPIVPSEVH